ncbi:MAG TPA: DUF4157 domain-containing protein [Gammaproteobacteria bacterium]
MDWVRLMRRYAAAVLALSLVGTAGSQPSETALAEAWSAPVLSLWIASSRDAALARGVDVIPPDIRAALAGFVPDDILDRVRWRVDDSALSVQQSLFRLGYTPAMTLDYVIVFATSADALTDAALWAHELFHVRQYRDWGVDGFAARYLEDYAAVEHDAAEFRWQWMKATGRVPAPGGRRSELRSRFLP